VYYGKWLPAATEFAERHRAALRSRPLWLFSSGPLGSPELKPEGDPEGVAALVAALEPREHRVFAGSLDRQRLGFGERLIVSAVHAQEGDFRDWETVATWGRSIARDLAAVAPRQAAETAPAP
jgi:menaquinone-dependent protoporphyrinogen oxidase